MANIQHNVLLNEGHHPGGHIFTPRPSSFPLGTHSRTRQRTRTNRRRNRENASRDASRKRSNRKQKKQQPPKINHYEHHYCNNPVLCLHTHPVCSQQENSTVTKQSRVSPATTRHMGMDALYWCNLSTMLSNHHQRIKRTHLSISIYNTNGNVNNSRVPTRPAKT